MPVAVTLSCNGTALGALHSSSPFFASWLTWPHTFQPTPPHVASSQEVDKEQDRKKQRGKMRTHMHLLLAFR